MTAHPQTAESAVVRYGTPLSRWVLTATVLGSGLPSSMAQSSPLPSGPSALTSTERISLWHICSRTELVRSVAHQ